MARKQYKKRRYRRRTSRRSKSQNDQLTILAFIFVALLLSGSAITAVLKEYSLVLIGFVTVCIIFIVGFFILKYYYEHNRRIQNINTVNSINDLLVRFKNKPTEFEHYIADIYRLRGYNAKVTPSTGDCGKDIILKKDNKKYVVEVKLYNTKSSIDRPKIQKLHSALIDEKADKAIFVTTSYFTQPAIEFAFKHRIELINGARLIKMIEGLKVNNS